MPERLSLQKIALGALLFLSVALQIQISFFAEGDYLGLRINLADLLLPFIGISIFISLILKRSLWPRFHVKYAYLWLAAITLVLTGALINYYITYNEISYWGLTNKLVGWVVLCCYFLMGGWFAINMQEKEIKIFLKSFVYFFLTVFFIQTLLFLLYYFNALPQTALNRFPMAGLMANKNAYIFLYLSAFAIASIAPPKYELIPTKALYLLWFLVPFTYAFTFARAGFLAFPIIAFLIFFMGRRADYKKLTLAFVLGFIALSSIHTLDIHYNIIRTIDGLHPARNTAFTDTTKILRSRVSGNTAAESLDKIKYSGDTIRMQLIHTGISMVKDHPIIGAGLGATTPEQIKQWGVFINIIDCTPLWLWAETGIIGLGVFLAFYLLCLYALWKNGRAASNDDFTTMLNKSVFIILILFGIMCLLHEILYTRFLWFFMGLALGYPLVKAKSAA